MSQQEALELAARKRREISGIVTGELDNYSKRREILVDQAEVERSKLNYLAFLIVGGVLGLSPEALQNNLVILGLSILLINAFLFGYVAQVIQRNLNMKHFEDAMSEEMSAISPYYEAYEQMLIDLDQSEVLSQRSFENVQDKFIEFHDWHKKKTISIAPKTKFAIGYWYLALYGIGLCTIGPGLVMKYNLQIDYFQII